MFNSRGHLCGLNDWSWPGSAEVKEQINPCNTISLQLSCCALDYYECCSFLFKNPIELNKWEGEREREISTHTKNLGFTYFYINLPSCISVFLFTVFCDLWGGQKEPLCQMWGFPGIYEKSYPLWSSRPTCQFWGLHWTALWVLEVWTLGTGK